jgi:hypothetical protein
MAGRRVRSRGEALVSSIEAEMAELGCVPTSAEAELLKMASSLADRLDGLERLIEKDGIIITTERGPKTNPAAVEARAVAQSLSRVLDKINISDTTTTPTRSEAAGGGQWLGLQFLPSRSFRRYRGTCEP